MWLWKTSIFYYEHCCHQLQIHIPVVAEWCHDCDGKVIQERRRMKQNFLFYFLKLKPRSLLSTMQQLDQSKVRIILIRRRVMGDGQFHGVELVEKGLQKTEKKGNTYWSAYEQSESNYFNILIASQRSTDQIQKIWNEHCAPLFAFNPNWDGACGKPINKGNCWPGGESK